MRAWLKRHETILRGVFRLAVLALLWLCAYRIDQAVRAIPGMFQIERELDSIERSMRALLDRIPERAALPAYVPPRPLAPGEHRKSLDELLNEHIERAKKAEQ